MVRVGLGIAPVMMSRVNRPVVVPLLLRLVAKEQLLLVTLSNRQVKSRPKVADSSPPAKSLA